MVQAAAVPTGASPIFLLSFRHRDTLAESVVRGGWAVIAARRSDTVERRFLGSGAAVAVIDARDAFDPALAATRSLRDAVEANAASLLVLLSEDPRNGPEAMFAAGATHFLMAPFDDETLRQAIRFAARHAERVAGGPRIARNRAFIAEGETGTWRWMPGRPTVTVAAALARRFGMAGGEISLAEASRHLGQRGMRSGRAAIGRLSRSGAPTAFAHDTSTGRIAHHIRFGPGGEVIGRLEDLSGASRRSSQDRDVLTGLMNGNALRRWLTIRLSRERPSRCGLILIALGQLDGVNSAYGPAAGDALLRSVARRIERQMSEVAAATCVARIAGTEFAVAIDGDSTVAQAAGLADMLATAIARPFATGDRLDRLTCRIGVAGAEPGDEAATMLRRASAALAQARAGDAGPIRVLDALGEAAAARRTRLEIDLREALARDEIELLFQPQVSVATGAIVGVEALARWRHPEFGSLGAVTLFSVAERSDFLLPLSEHVQRKALAQAAAWPDALGHLRLAVNVTASDVARPDFADRFLRMVDASGFPRGRLTVELTENGMVEDLCITAGLLATLRAEGLRVAVDDFGTGYSSLAYLKALPLDYLKIDKRLADDITGSPRDRVVVRGVIEMARSLGLSVIVEGVEHDAQLALLAAEGCNYYQGFLCSPPVDETTLERLVAGYGWDAARTG